MTENGEIKYFYKRMELGDIENDTQQNAYVMAVDALEEIQEYRTLGTVEELRLVKEKQISKKPKTDDRYVMYICPCCNDFVKVSHNYCQNCGQKLDWSDSK